MIGMYMGEEACQRRRPIIALPKVVDLIMVMLFSADVSLGPGLCHTYSECPGTLESTVSRGLSEGIGERLRECDVPARTPLKVDMMGPG
jgi:hypothetical protein